MAGLSPKFPLHFSSLGGYANNETVKEVVKQNLKNLVLTSPGERIMIPDFGVGLKNFLFEQNVESSVSILNQRLQNQVNKYMPFINIQEFSPEYEENQLIIKIKYFIIPISETDILRVSS